MNTYPTTIPTLKQYLFKQIREYQPIRLYRREDMLIERGYGFQKEYFLKGGLFQRKDHT